MNALAARDAVFSKLHGTVLKPLGFRKKGHWSILDEAPSFRTVYQGASRWSSAEDIMVLELKVPHDPDFRALIPLWPVFMSYVLSFVYVGIYWNKLQYASYPSSRRCVVLGTLGLAALLAGCTPKPTKADEELQIQQTVLRYQFEHNAAANKYAIFCIAISKGEIASDAPAKLIQGLNDATHKVVKSSDCNAHMDNGVTERSSGKPALMLNVGKVNWLAKDEAVVEGGYYEAGLSSSGNTYHLKKVSGVWRVVQNQLNWIS